MRIRARAAPTNPVAPVRKNMDFVCMKKFIRPKETLCNFYGWESATFVEEKMAHDCFFEMRPPQSLALRYLDHTAPSLSRVNEI